MLAVVLLVSASIKLNKFEGLVIMLCSLIIPVGCWILLYLSITWHDHERVSLEMAMII